MSTPAHNARDEAIKEAKKSSERYWDEVTNANKEINDKILNEDSGSIAQYKKSMEKAFTDYNTHLTNSLSTFKTDSNNALKDYSNNMYDILNQYNPEKHISSYEAKNDAARKRAEDLLGANKSEYQKQLEKYTGENAAKSINELASQQAVKNASDQGAATVGSMLAAGANPATALAAVNNNSLNAYNSMFGQQQGLVGNQFANAAAGAGNIYSNEAGNIRDLLNNATNQYATALGGNLAGESTRLQSRTNAQDSLLQNKLGAYGTSLQGDANLYNNLLNSQANSEANKLSAFNNAVATKASNAIGGAGQDQANWLNLAQTGQSSQNTIEKLWNDLSSIAPWNWG